MSVTQEEIVRHYEQRQREALEAIAWFEELADRVDADLAAYGEQMERALGELALAYLPDLTEEALQRAEKLSGFRGFSRRDPLAALEREKKTLQRTIARVVAEEDYRRREYLVGPNGELTTELAEIEFMLEPWEQECAKFEDQPGFTELIAVNYDTPDFSVPWTSARYWKLWAAGDRITEELGMEDFGDDVLPAWEKVSSERTKWRYERARVEKEMDRIHELVKAHDQAQARIPQLPELYLEQARKMLAQYLENADLALLEQWLGEDGDRGVKMGIRKLAGLQAKMRILRELRTEGVEMYLQNFRSRRAKYGRKASKFQRAKHYGERFPERYMDLEFSEKLDKYKRRRDKTMVLLDRIREFEEYEDVELDTDPNLWWVVMTNKKPTRMTPKLRSWWERNEDATLFFDEDEREEDNASAVAAAALARENDELGYLS